MPDTATQPRIKQIADPGPPPSPVGGNENVRDIAPAPVPAPTSPDRPPTVSDHLARIEEKTARIEEKLSRSEAFTARVIDRFEASSHRMTEVAQQAELMAVRSETKFIARRIRGLPGFSALVLTSAITAVLTAVILVAIIRFMPALIGR